MRTDPGIEPTREARRQISERADHDAQKLVRHYLEYQKRFSNRLRSSTNQQTAVAEQ